jgi:hypothetical protein
LRIAAGQRQRQGEGASPGRVATLAQSGDVVLEAGVLRALGLRHAQRRPDALLPVAVDVQAFLRRVAQILFVVGRMRGIRVALQHAELGQQLARRACLARRQRQVMRAERMRRNLVLSGARIATLLAFHFQQQEIVAARTRQLPGRRESADAATDDGNGDPPRFAGYRKIGLAQAMAEVVVGARKRSGWQWRHDLSAAGGEQATGRNAGKEVTTIHKRSAAVVVARPSCRFADFPQHASRLLDLG